MWLKYLAAIIFLSSTARGSDPLYLLNPGTNTLVIVTDNCYFFKINGDVELSEPSMLYGMEEYIRQALTNRSVRWKTVTATDLLSSSEHVRLLCGPTNSFEAMQA